jgi:hypothetical protein
MVADLEHFYSDITTKRETIFHYRLAVLSLTMHTKRRVVAMFFVARL